MLPASLRARQTLAIVALSAVALTGCNNASPNASGDARSSKSPTEKSERSETADSSDNSGVKLVERDSAKKDSKSSPTPSASPSATPSAKSTEPATPPEGYQTATADVVGVTFAVPDTWAVYTKFDEGEINEMAATLGSTADEVSSATLKIDLVAMARTRDEGGLLEHFQCGALAVPLGVVSEETFTKKVTEDGHTVEHYATVETVHGTGSYIAYYDAERDIKFARMYLPNHKGAMVSSLLGVATDERRQELIDQIVATWR